MFPFMKSKEERERKKKEKKEKKESLKRAKDKDKTQPLTQDELQRLDEAKRGLFMQGSSDENLPQSGKVGNLVAAYSHKFTPQLAPYDVVGARQQREKHSPSQASDSSETSSVGSYGVDMEMMKRPTKPGPSVGPRPPHRPKRGILKGKSNYGPEIPNQGVRATTGSLDDTVTLEENTILNEMMSGQLVNNKGSGDDSDLPPDEPPPPLPDSGPPANGEVSDEHTYENVVISRTSVTHSSSLSGTIPEDAVAHFESREKSYDVDLPLPAVAPPKTPIAREIILQRQPAGDFGFSLRRGSVLERGLGDNSERKRMVIFAEPGSGPKNQTGLLPGDRLIEVNGVNVENSTREEIIDLIKKSGDSVTLKVQPIPELSELSVRSGLDGGESVPLAEERLKTGTLQRSGSLRYKNQVAKSDDQLASEKAWMSAEKVWLVHKGGFAGARLLKANGVAALPEGRCKVKLDHGGDVIEVDEDDVEKANPPSFDRVEDLASLRFLNESGVLHTLRQRYGSNLIHTYSGPSLVVINPMHPLSIYSEKVIQMFRGCKQEDMPPHIYAIAQNAYRSMLATRTDQSIVFTGRSGSGKSTNAKHVLHYLTVAAGTVNNLVNVDKLNAITILLDSFGNSRTVMNTNATRYTSLFSLDFDHTGQIASASVQVLMLDKTRVARRPEGEPTFHVFYQMLAGVDAQLRNELQLGVLNEPNLFMTPIQRNEDRQRATQAWAKILHAMTILGITSDESKSIFCVLASIYHLGVAGATKGANNKWQFLKPAAAQRAAVLLGTSVEELARSIFAPSPTPQPRSPFRSPSDRSASSSGEQGSGLDALEGFVCGLYQEAVNAVVSLINRSLSSTYRTVSSIIMLDMPGFQNPASCGRQTGATFDDLCHNYVQERLQLMFHDATFTSQQDRYAQENIDCDFDTVTSTPAPLVSLIDKPSTASLVRSTNKNMELRDGDQRGLLWLLDEEAIFPGSSDDSFVERLFLHHGDKQERRESLLHKASQRTGFVLNHFLGTCPVQYNASGWLKACRENPLSKIAPTFLQDSQKPHMASLFMNLRGPVSGTLSGSVVGIEGSSSLRRASSIRRSYTSGAAGLKRKSVCLQVKFQVDTLVDTIRRSKVHFVQNILPQHNAGLCDLKASLLTAGKAKTEEEVILNVPLVRSQIRGNEMLEAVRIYRQGYPEHMLFNEFRNRFDCLVPQSSRTADAVVDEKQAVSQILEHLEVEKSSYRLGLSKVFFRAGALAQLEDSRDEKISDIVVAFQGYARGYLGRENLKKLKLQHLAISCIQRNVKKFMAIRDWSWWKLYTKVQPLLNVHRTEEELKNKDLELEQVKAKLEKLEKERNEYKHSVDKLDTKLQELTADLSEEHTTSTHATEVLETETAERMRLEKELKELQSKYSTVHRKNEQLEMEVMQSRVWQSSYDDYDEDEADGDSIYKPRYEQVRRELDFTKKKLEQQHEEELDQERATKKNVERKLTESLEDSEEQRRQVANLRRKCQRVTAEMQDMKLHLEEQTGRNADLEKKQRKFDAELNRIAEDARQEKHQREVLQRERDALSGEKYTLEQQLNNIKMDLELQTEKVERLERELADLTSVGSRDNNEVMTLKRARNELESKVRDQEEELDEQAGTIQQLEQAKLRLEMTAEKTRQQHSKELEEKEQELEDMRYSTQKKVKQIESQLEEEYEERQQILREKRELERKMGEIGSMAPSRDRDMERRLRRDLKRTKALLRDAQMMLDRQKNSADKRTTVKQLRNQLEDAEFATAAAVKARKGIEVEVADLQLQIEDLSRQKAAIEEKSLQLSREKNEFQTRLEEGEEDMAELMKKYKAAVQQQSVDQINLQDQSTQLEELSVERETLKEQVSALTSKLEYTESSSVDRHTVTRLEGKIKELESRLELESTTRHRLEVQSDRLKENVERVSQDKMNHQSSEQRSQEIVKRMERQLRDVMEEQGEVAAREAEASQRKHDLETKVESLESDYEQAQADLKLAFKRIADLQHIIEDDMDSDLSDLTDSEASDTDSEGEPYLAMNHKVGRGSSLSSLDTTPSRPEGASVSSLDMTPRSDIHSSPSHSSPNS